MKITDKGILFMERLKQQLQAEEIRFVENESLAAHCTFKIGGPGGCFCPAGDRRTALPRDRTVQSVRCEYYLLGNGSNILFEDGATGAWSWIPRL